MKDRWIAAFWTAVYAFSVPAVHAMPLRRERSSDRLRGKTAVVTGGSGTIGKAIAMSLLSREMNVVLVARNLEKLNEVKDELEALLVENEAVAVEGFPCTPRPTVSAFAADVTDETSVTALFDELDEKCIGCDLLVNNAGINGPVCPPVDLPGSELTRTLEVNVVGPFLCAREALRRMIRRRRDRGGKGGGGGGRIINVGSLSAISPRPNSACYTTSKFALLGLTHSLSLDAREHGVTVGIIHPGNVRSGFLSEEVFNAREETEGFIDPEDVAECVLTMAGMPDGANVLELTVLPTRQPLVGRG